MFLDIVCVVVVYSRFGRIRPRFRNSSDHVGCQPRSFSLNPTYKKSHVFGIVGFHSCVRHFSEVHASSNIIHYRCLFSTVLVVQDLI